MPYPYKSTPSRLLRWVQLRCSSHTTFKLESLAEGGARYLHTHATAARGGCTVYNVESANQYRRICLIEATKPHLQFLASGRTQPAMNRFLLAVRETRTSMHRCLRYGPGCARTKLGSHARKASGDEQSACQTSQTRASSFPEVRHPTLSDSPSRLAEIRRPSRGLLVHTIILTQE